MICVRAFPRLHIGLMDLGNATGRRFGGAGFMLDWCPVEVQVRRGKSSITDLKVLDKRGRTDVAAALKRISDVAALAPMRITLCRVPPQHVGLGTKTATILAVLKAAAQQSNLAIEASAIQSLSGRGGASGIGIHGFFRGGFLVDAGHPAVANGEFLPSAAVCATHVPTLVTRVAIPEQWRFLLFLPNGFRYSGRSEARFFRQNTPIPKPDVRDALALLYHGIVPAMVEGKIDELRLALVNMHRVGFKKRELIGQPYQVRKLLQLLSQHSECAAGMSSMGPLVYAVVPFPSDELISSIARVADGCHARLLAVCRGRNRGHEVRNADS